MTPNSMGLARAYPSPAETTLVVMSTDPVGCTEAYSGIFRQATVFVVGYDTPDERLYVRGDRTAALAYAKANKLTFDQVPARALCHETALALLGS